LAGTRSAFAEGFGGQVALPALRLTPAWISDRIPIAHHVQTRRKAVAAAKKAIREWI
jgi:hypothetical protein